MTPEELGVFIAATQPMYGVLADMTTKEAGRYRKEFAAEIADYLREARREALEEAAKIADHESGEYKANGEKCDRSGNHVGGTMDCASALACERVAQAIRELIATSPPSVPGKLRGDAPACSG